MPVMSGHVWGDAAVPGGCNAVLNFFHHYDADICVVWALCFILADL